MIISANKLIVKKLNQSSFAKKTLGKIAKLTKVFRNIWIPNKFYNDLWHRYLTALEILKNHQPASDSETLQLRTSEQVSLLWDLELSVRPQSLSFSCNWSISEEWEVFPNPRDLIVHQEMVFENWRGNFSTELLQAAVSNNDIHSCVCDLHCIPLIRTLLHLDVQ